VLNNVKKSDISPRELVERELLSYLIRYPDYLQALRAQEVKADSFLTGPHREIARYLFDLEQGGYQINEAVLLSYFSGPEMQRLIMQMAVATDLVEEVRVQKAITDCLKKIKTLHWAAEREMLIKSLQDSEKIKEISATLKRISELKKWEEELYRSGEGEDLDV
jgi:replicative DNA helicase